MTSPVSPTVVQLPSPGGWHSPLRIPSLRTREPGHPTPMCKHTHRETPTCIHLTRALSFTHTHTHVHALDHTLPMAFTYMPMCKHLSMCSLCLSHTHANMPMCMHLCTHSLSQTHTHAHITHAHTYMCACVHAAVQALSHTHAHEQTPVHRHSLLAHTQTRMLTCPCACT